MVLTKDVKRRVMAVGFVSSGISAPNILEDLPHGPIGSVCTLRLSKDELPTAKSVILMSYYAWDPIFNLQVDSAYFRSRERYTPKVQTENYQLYYEILKNKAWTVVNYLRKKGFESTLSLGISLKTSAVRAGLGCQGKNTLLVTPSHGPRVRLISVLTTAELDTDEPFKEDLCKDCEKCVIACPTQALEPYKIKINRCLTYAAEKPYAQDVTKDVRKLERKLIMRPTPNSYVECWTCIEACPIGKLRQKHLK